MGALHHAGLHGAGPYNNNYQILQTPTHVVIVHEMIHDARIIHSTGGHARPEHSPMVRRFARPLGGPDARRRDDELQRQMELQRIHGKLRLTERFTRVDNGTVSTNLRSTIRRRSPASGRRRSPWREPTS